MKVKIELIGCDDSTIIEKEISESNYNFLKEIEEEINKTSTYVCMPTISIKEK